MEKQFEEAKLEELKAKDANRSVTTSDSANTPTAPGSSSSEPKSSPQTPEVKTGTNTGFRKHNNFLLL